MWKGARPISQCGIRLNSWFFLNIITHKKILLHCRIISSKVRPLTCYLFPRRCWISLKTTVVLPLYWTIEEILLAGKVSCHLWYHNTQGFNFYHQNAGQIENANQCDHQDQFSFAIILEQYHPLYTWKHMRVLFLAKI